MPPVSRAGRERARRGPARSCRRSCRASSTVVSEWASRITGTTRPAVGLGGEAQVHVGRIGRSRCARCRRRVEFRVLRSAGDGRSGRAGPAGSTPASGVGGVDARAGLEQPGGVHVDPGRRVGDLPSAAGQLVGDAPSRRPVSGMRAGPASAGCRSACRGRRSAAVSTSARADHTAGTRCRAARARSRPSSPREPADDRRDDPWRSARHRCRGRGGV